MTGLAAPRADRVHPVPHTLAEDDVTVLLAVLTHGGGPEYAAWRKHLDAEHNLKAAV